MRRSTMYRPVFDAREYRRSVRFRLLDTSRSRRDHRRARSHAADRLLSNRAIPALQRRSYDHLDIHRPERGNAHRLRTQIVERIAIRRAMRDVEQMILPLNKAVI